MKNQTKVALYFCASRDLRLAQKLPLARAAVREGKPLLDLGTKSQNFPCLYFFVFVVAEELWKKRFLDS
jgi:hypothetical protein